MRVLIVGSGGREHALAKAIAKSALHPVLFGIGVNAGMSGLAEMQDIKLSDHQAILSYAWDKEIDFAVIGPDQPLVDGLVDLLETGGIRCFGPNKRASRVEGSKAWAKAFMQRHHIPTPAYRVFSDVNEAMEYGAICPLPIVIKADGLALGKGVVIADDRSTLFSTLTGMMVDHIHGKSGETVVMEQFVTGPEVSLLVLCDGEHALPLLSAMDHKRAWDGDQGPNTGGMGVVAPNPYYTQEVADFCMQNIVLPTIRGLKEEGSSFVGCLFFGLMITPDAPTVIEYNCRFGDPEAEAVLALLDDDLLDLLLSAREGTLDARHVRFHPGYAVSVTVASRGYPVCSEIGKQITIGKMADNVEVLYAAVAQTVNGELISTGGRVLHVVGRGSDIQEAREAAYEAVKQTHFTGMHYRTDIGFRALKREESDGSSGAVVS
ncbi:MAG: phosphoribosylamine--glycine ligase [Sphaerochaeta sp.]|nr:phosphoribosylamine--glycine ligase [Sphaerochaeta sp.]